MAFELYAPSRAEAVANSIEDLIRRRALEPGDRIGNKAEIQKQFGVARSTVGEAFKLLHERDAVTVRSGPHGGLFVAERNARINRLFSALASDVSRVTDAIAFRDHLEPLVLLQATRHRTADDIRELQALKQAMFEGPTRPEEVLTSVWAVHRRIGQAVPNTFLRATYLGLMDFLPDHLSAAAHRLDHPEAFAMARIRVHAELIDAIESGDEERMKAAIAEHDEPLG